MEIMVLGLGVIGATYGYAFHKAGHTVEHFIRPNKRDFAPQELAVRLLDGRRDSQGEAASGIYPVVQAQPGKRYDFILVSVSAGKLEAAMQTLKQNEITGTVLLFNGIWEERDEVERVMTGWEYLLGYPVAGGSLDNRLLDCVLFDHIMLESREKAGIRNYDDLLLLLRDAGIQAEVPYDVLEWIWLHMAINAGVITTAANYGDVHDTARAANAVMDSSKALKEAVLSIRETSGIIAARGVDLSRYKNELTPYKIPAGIAGVVMKRMFATNQLTRRIMELHSNVDDLLYVCRNVYECGKNNGVDAPLFYANYERMYALLQEG